LKNENFKFEICTLHGSFFNLILQRVSVLAHAAQYEVPRPLEASRGTQERPVVAGLLTVG
jgi:hypothetical protein